MGTQVLLNGLPGVTTAWQEEMPGLGSRAEQALLMWHKKRGSTCSPA